MSKIKYSTFLITLVFLFGIFFSCKKEFKTVPVKTIAVGTKITIDSLRKLYAILQTPTKFTSNTSLYAVVTMDETSGNIYKQVYLRDNSGSAVTNGYGAIVVHLKNSGGLYLGDSVMINLNGSVLDMSSGGSLQIDSLDVVNNVAKIKTGLNPLPITVTMPQLTSAWESQLIQLYGVEFNSDDVGSTYAIPQNAPAAAVSVNRYINDCIGNQMVAYNSGYANFAGQVIPNANGSIIAIANLYSTMQLTLRSYGDINLNSAYCPIILDTMNQTFLTAALASKKNVLLAGWKNIAYAGSLKWIGGQWGSGAANLSPSASNYKSTDARNDIWLVTPPIMDAGGGVNKYLNFTTAVQYPTAPYPRQMSVLVSGSFDGTNIITAQWTDISSLFPYISVNKTPPNFIWASNNQPYFSNQPCIGFVPPANSGTFYIAFRYQSNLVDSTGVTCLLHKVHIKNNP